MQISKALRRDLSAVCAVLLLACQGIGTGYARPAGAADLEVVAQTWCHDVNHQITGEKFRDTCQANCETQHVATALSGAHVYAIADLPSVAVVSHATAAADASPPPDPPLLRVEPPPHALLHCCQRQ